MKKLISIDIAKAICIILVVVGHYIPENAPHWYINMRSIIYTFHMPLFMFASGYIFQSYRINGSYIEFMKKKTKRLVIPYISTSLLILTVKLISQKSMQIENPIDVYTYFEILYRPSAAYFLWFIWVLFLIFIITPLFYKGIHINLLLGISILLNLIPFSFPDIFCVNELKYYLVYFLLGVYLSEHRNMIKIIQKYQPLLSCVLFTFVVLFKFMYNINSSLLDFMLGVLGIYCIMNISIWINQCNILIKRVLVNLSVYSFSIYLFHTTFQGFLKSIINRFIPNHLLMNQLFFVVTAILIISIGIIGPCMLQKYILDENKVLGYLFGRNFKTKSESNKLIEEV